MLQIDSVLVPIDFSEHAERALAHARELAASHGAALEVLHVIEEPDFPSFYKTAYKAVYDTPAPNLEETARAALEALIDKVKGADVERGTGYYVRKGRAAEEVVRLAEEHNIDLIVIASHGLTGIEHLLLGSVAEKVVRSAPCPVLVLKAFGKSLLDGEPSPAGT